MVQVVFGTTSVSPGIVDPSDPVLSRPGTEGRPLLTPEEERAQALAERAPEQGLEPEAERVPYEIDARRFVLEGNQYFRASGDVVVTRDSLTAVADSLEYDQDQGAIYLHENARVNTAQSDLSSETIRLAVPEDEIREARAVGKAVLEGEDLTLAAPIVTLFFTDGIMDRLVAVRDPVEDSIRAEMDDETLERHRQLQGEPPPSVRGMGLSYFPERPHAVAQDFALDGDSLEVLAPGEVLDEVWAMGTARGESAGRDSLNTEDTPELIQRDWLEGDTIVAYFGELSDSAATTEVTPDEPEPVDPPPEDDPDPDLGRGAAEADSAGAKYRLERLVAKVEARSMYRMAPSDSTVAEEPGRFAVHYVTGEEITILLNEEGEAEHMEVVGQTRGIHLEPLAQAAMADSLAPPDTAAVEPPDTASIPPDTTGVPPPDTAVVPPPDTTKLMPPDTTGAEPLTFSAGVQVSGVESTMSRRRTELPSESRRTVYPQRAAALPRYWRRAPGGGPGG
jgi:hypothetical protein